MSDNQRKVSLSSDFASWGEYELIRQFVKVDDKKNKPTRVGFFSIGKWDVSVATFEQYVDRNLRHVKKIRAGWRKFFVDGTIKKKLIKNIRAAAPRFSEYMKYVDVYETKSPTFDEFSEEIKQKFQLFQDVMTEKRQTRKHKNKKKTNSLETNQWEPRNQEIDDNDSTWSDCTQ